MPISIVARLEFWRSQVREQIKGGLWLIPSCHECNNLAGAIPFVSILEKRQFIKKRIKQKYRKYLKRVMWDDDELVELGKNLQSAVLRGLQSTARVELRLSWPLATTRIQGEVIRRFRLVK